MDDVNEILEEEKDFGFARIYSVELKYKQKPKLDRDLLYQKMELYTGTTSMPDQKEADTGELAVWEAYEPDMGPMLHFFHMNYMLGYAEGEMPAQTSLMNIEHRPAEEYITAVQQSWHWREAEQTLEECNYSLTLIDIMASGLEPKSRLELFSGALRAVLETCPCDAIYFRESDKLVEPKAYLAAVEEGAILYGAMNLRLYNVEGTGSERAEKLMDTVGLAALGIPDIQCHYYDLEPNEVADHMSNIGYYLFSQGDIIQDGETVGFTEDMRWRCEHQYALAAPHRVVLDLDPGAPYYAGRQNNSDPADETE
ncbi:DUF4261 domain-containing protein [Paenibacillus aceti]|uniref:DUF4261 domain-containing protein n=1 Tax=Paenibacillus aceti TaxID=1820010 RepID=A0ABQ1VZT8_9BACL|nr:DUF4261 domain-containing protein [Paenibacillus aceti]GGG06339.1 hypothetical protein GCM10010913_30250 [Paenibacillus aceti]